jgi:membrane protein
VDLTGSRILIWVVERLGSLVVLTLLFAVLYRTLPDAPVRWSDVWTGAFLAAILITLGTWAFGWYLGRASVTSSYGAAGALAAFLLWIYYSAQIFFLGAELTTVQAHRARPQESPEPTAFPPPPSRREPDQKTLKSEAGHTPPWIARLGWIGLGVVLARLFGK